MIVAANPLAAEAGREILRRGGSAVDAAIAAAMVLNLVEPQSSGLGGGGFMLAFDARHKSVQAFEGRETAPASAKPGRFLGPDGKPLEFEDAQAGGPTPGAPLAPPAPQPPARSTSGQGSTAAGANVPGAQAVPPSRSASAICNRPTGLPQSDGTAH